jgi:UDP-glucuronate decarboxylase
MYNYDVIYEECSFLSKKINIEKFKNSNILITGANGLIGGFLADFFVYINKCFSLNINLFLTSKSKKDNLKRIKHIVEDNTAKYFSWDCTTRIEHSKIPEKIDFCFFCSGYGQPAKFLKNSIATCLINVVGVESILEHMDKKGGKFLFLSTSEVYGTPPTDFVPTPESYNGVFDLQNNRSCYIVSKRLGEILCKQYAENNNVETKIARVALTYGPGALFSDERVLQDFLFKAQNGNINLLDEGASRRNYLYITNCVYILIYILTDGKELVYNVGGDVEEITIYELANKVASFFNIEAIKKNKLPSEATKEAPKIVSLAMDRFRNEFPEYEKEIISLDEGIKRTIKWFNLGGTDD